MYFEQWGKAVMRRRCTLGRLTRTSLNEIGDEAGDDRLHLVEPSLEKVVRTLHRHHALWRGQLFKPRRRQVVGSQLVLRALDNQLGFMAILQVVSIEHTCRTDPA